MFWKAKAQPIIHKRAVSERTKVMVLNRDGWKCQLCGFKTKTRAFLHIDHKVALARGGTNEISNLQVLCAECNLKKGKKVINLRRSIVGNFYTWAIWLSVLALVIALLLHH